MDKKIKFLFIAGSVIVIALIFGVNLLMKRYGKESSASFRQEKAQVRPAKEEIPVKNQKETQTATQEDPEDEPPIQENVLLR
jgi:hypothetical protein